MPFDWEAGTQTGIGYGLLPGIAQGFLTGKQNRDIDKIMNQIPDELRKYLQPYIDAGMGALPHLNDISGEYERMYKDPNAIISNIAKGYTQSPGYKWKLDQGTNAITNAAASGGMAGTAQHQQQAGELATNLANQDFNEFLERALGVYRGGLSGRTGIEQNIFNTGADKAGDLATSLANALMAKAGIKYQRQGQQNAFGGDIASSIMSMFGK